MSSFSLKVSDKYKDGWKEIVTKTMEGRYGENGTEAIVSYLKEQNVTLDSQVYLNIQNAVIAGRRNLTTEQALRVEISLGYEEGFLAILQTFYDIKQYKEKELANSYTGYPNIRRILFWDTDFDKINWGKYKKAVIERVIERGSKDEISEIKRFYKLSASELKQYKPKKIRITRINQKTNG